MDHAVGTSDAYQDDNDRRIERRGGHGDPRHRVAGGHIREAKRPMRPTQRNVAALGLLVPAFLAAACSGAPAAPSATAAAASALPPATAAAPSAAPVSTSALGGGFSVSSILGGNQVEPASTTWIRVVDASAPFTYEVPSTWTVHVASPWEEGGATIGIALAAGPDLSKLSTDFSVPGVVIGVAANATQITPRQALAADDFSSVCTATPIQEATESGASVAWQLWQSCAGGTGLLLVMAIAPSNGQGRLGIVFQGTGEQDLAYLDHIVSSLAATTPGATSAPAATGGAVSGQTYTISMDTCQNQHGQGVSGGLIRNDDTLIHSYRIVVAFSDPNGIFLNDTAWTTSDLQPGVTATWQATVPSGLPAVSVSCQITSVELVR